MKHTILICAMLLSALATACAQPASHAPVTTSDSASFAAVYVPRLPQTLDFAGERVPLENYDTRESLLRELLTTGYLHSRTMQTLLATTRYLPVIEPILRKHGVPDDFKYLCMAESGLNPNVTSTAGAAGLWQIMKAYATQAGLYMGGKVDERFHIEKSTEAACQYLLDAKARFGSWTLAAAAYNVGPAGVATRMKTQGVDNYYDLFLPEETMRYIFRILSFKLIASDPAHYGYEIAPDDYFPPLNDYTEVTVTGTHIDWSAEARKHGTTYKMLRQLNHWIRDYEYNNKTARSFVLKVPNEGHRR